MAQELWVRDDTERTYFKRLIDLYVAAAIVGFRVDRKAEEDYSPFETSSIFPEQMLKEKENLDFILQMMIMLNYRGTLTDEECVKKAFQGHRRRKNLSSIKRCSMIMSVAVWKNYTNSLSYERQIRMTDFMINRTANLMALMTRYGAGKNESYSGK